MEVKGVGVDLVAVGRVRQAVDRWKERFLNRIFTPEELEYCLRRRDPIPHLAARFAAKEACLKALGTGLSMGVQWRELEVRRAPGVPPILVLSGRAKAIGTAKGASQILLSLAHDGEYAFAQALLVGPASLPGSPLQRDQQGEPHEEVR